MSNGGSRYPRQQRRHFATRVAFGKRFEELTAGIHQRDDDRGQFLPDDERCCHRQDRNDIEADFTTPQACNNVVNEDDQNRNRERRPDTILPADCPSSGIAKPRARPKAGNNTNNVRTKKPASISNDLTEARDCPTGAIPGSKCDTGLAGISDHRPEQLPNAGGER